MIRADWTPTLEEFRAFARLSGDDNPIHTDPDYAASHPFGRPVAHGMLLHARLQGLALQAGLGPMRHLAMMFPNPAYAGEALVLTITPGDKVTATATRSDGVAVCVATWVPA
jgi:acyl dehydratase